MTDAPTGQQEHRHASPGEQPAPVDVPAAPAWLHGPGEPAARSGGDAWRPGAGAVPTPTPSPDPPEQWTAILPPPAVRTHRTAVVVLSILLGLVLAGSGGLTWYLLRVNAAWQEHSQEWQALAEQHGADLAQTRSDLEATRTELASVQDQLTNAQNRITQLADEKAQLGDESAAQQQLADYQARVSKAAGQVATALATCIDGQQKLVTYLEDPASWDPNSLATYRQQVDDYCDSARNANAALQAELAQ